MKTDLLMTALFLGLGSFPLTTRADLISDWHKTGSDYVNQHADFQFTRALTMMHVAQFDAINAAVGGYSPYALYVSAPGASPEAAAAQAAYTVLTNISRSNLPTLNSALARSLRAVPEGRAKEDGILLGRLAAKTIIALRAADNYRLKIPAPTNSAMGKWRLAPPSFKPGDGAQYRYFLPWTMKSQAQFQPGPPPSLQSEQYATDLEEVRLLGGRISTNRTASQTAAANFFPAANTFLEAAARARTLPLIESARAHALFHMMVHDILIAFLEAQYTYSFWRPITAIHNAENDGNDATVADLKWTPLRETPDHPEYPSGTCAVTSGVVTVLTNFYGDDFSFTATSGGVTRRFDRLSAGIPDAVEARIAAGAHYRFSCLVGVDMGRAIAEHALRSVLRPLPQLAGERPLRTGEFQVHLQSGSPITYLLETSPDLTQWTPWLTNAFGVILHNDPGGPEQSRRFYRARVIE